MNIDKMVDRFLSWPLPKSVCSDACVSMTDYQFPRFGTSLLSADEARQMLAHVATDAECTQCLELLKAGTETAELYEALKAENLKLRALVNVQDNREAERCHVNR